MNRTYVSNSFNSVLHIAGNLKRQLIRLIHYVKRDRKVSRTTNRLTSDRLNSIMIETEQPIAVTELRQIVKIPLKWIDSYLPNHELKEVFNQKKVHYSNIPGFFWAGNWDLKALKIQPHYHLASSSFRSVHQMLSEGISYDKTDEYLEKIDQIERSGKSARGTSREELNAYFEGLLKLADTIDKEGYKLQSETGGDPIDEIGVFIGRDGKILKAEDKFCGTHRFAIASVLGIEKIPVAILAVHEDLMEQYLNDLSDPASLLKRLSQH